MPHKSATGAKSLRNRIWSLTCTFLGQLQNITPHLSAVIEEPATITPSGPPPSQHSQLSVEVQIDHESGTMKVSYSSTNRGQL